MHQITRHFGSGGDEVFTYLLEDSNVMVKSDIPTMMAKYTATAKVY
jgi:hypothetical protein